MTIAPEELRRIVAEITPALVALRRDIHAHPELAFEEVRTAGVVAAQLEALGLPPRTGIGRTGVVAVARGARAGRTVGVRADLDALPVMERTGLPFASTVPGRMHACGHDVHTAIGLGVAMVMARLRDRLPGHVAFIFQPAEEIGGGAPAMLADGIFDDLSLDAILGFHNWPALDAGTVGWVDAEAVMASSHVFDIELVGRGGHAAHPHLSVDTVVAAAQLVMQLQTIVSREIAPLVPAVVTVGRIDGGTARNAIAERTLLQGAARTLHADAATHVEAAIRRAVESVAAGFRVEHRFTWRTQTPAVRNDPATLAVTLDAVRATLGPDQVVRLPGPSMGSEDFAFFAERVPAAHLRIGGRVPGLQTFLHRADYVCNEEAIPTGVLALAGAALALLDPRRESPGRPPA